MLWQASRRSLLNNTIRNSTRFQLLILRIFNICFLKVNLRIILFFKRCFFSQFLPLVAASGINNTQICNVQSKLGTCVSQENLILTEHSANKRVFEATSNNRKLPSPYACFRLATYTCLNLLKGTIGSSFYRSELWTCSKIPVSYSQQKTKNLNTKLGHICPSLHFN